MLSVLMYQLQKMPFIKFSLNTMKLVDLWLVLCRWVTYHVVVCDCRM